MKVLGTNLLTDALGITKVPTFTDEVGKLKSWIKLRYEWLDFQWGNP
ncbi:MAG: hypothetical protein J5891_06425 [Spirochaetales bacterium]|nr:hypothetical protein [Spirochaetales bacterium]